MFPAANSKRFLRLDSRGQEGAPFRLLVEAIMVVFILVIIIGMLNWIDSIKTSVSEKRLFDGFEKALNSPDGKVIFEEDLILKGGSTYTSRSFAEFANMGEKLAPGCISISAIDSSAFEVTSPAIIEIITLIQTSVYYRCKGTDGGGCEMNCEIRFGDDEFG